MHKKWQQELNSIKLSSTQKERLKASMTTQVKPKQRNARIIFPVFVACALLFFMWGPSAPDSLTTATNKVVFESITLRIIIWLTIAQLLLVVTYIVGIICIRRVKRWEHRPTVQRLRTLFSTSFGNVIGTFTLLSFFALMWGVTIAFPHTLVAEAFFTAAILLFAIVTFTYFTRDHYKPSCPHCGVRYTRKQLVKLGFRTEPKCPTCAQKFTTAPHFSGTYAWVPAMMLLQYTTLYYVYVVFLFITIGLFIIVYIIPYSTQYVEIGNDDLPPPLW